MAARYLIRLDDACPEMEYERWQRVEEILDEFKIRPIVAVVPDNRDDALRHRSADPGFWDKVRNWQSKGWAIAMHGHTHVMHPTSGRILVPYYRRSEFAGLSFEQQKLKVRSAWNLFLSQRVEPKIWVAPAHSFDALTLKALREETPIRIVSDGIAWNSFYEDGFYWIPQQMWKLAPRKSGLWTVCLHPNQMNEEASARLRHDIRHIFQTRIGSVDDVALTRRRKSLTGRIYDSYFWFRWRRANPDCR
jgi:predicted deacetylase